ncbi:hypothetical protein [Alicyclobacillus mengziensis]|uniref:Uncharacterized protein n=1 Tax=Alicyclobacillus mengziensis TaxID=2931921 RepID=A0A9X7VWU7_9BACL|nr:hypothetical protein [Alicyclobacillus mengziensis]QSO46300.1 hypothetical protein JZ786_17610 [Alicyclobacillus mengziensis]
MPNFIWIGFVAVDTPQQNSNGVNVGQFNSSGWDADMKFNTAQGGNFGTFSTNITAGSLMLDNLEVADGNINDADFKPAIDTNI